MPSVLSITEVSAFCIASLDRCFKSGNDYQSVQVMKNEVRQIAREVAAWQLSGEAKARIFLKPMEDLLVQRYGSQVGRRLYWDYLDAFWLQSWSVRLLVPTESDLKIEPILEECRATG